MRGKLFVTTLLHCDTRYYRAGKVISACIGNEFSKSVRYGACEEGMCFLDPPAWKETCERRPARGEKIVAGPATVPAFHPVAQPPPVRLQRKKYIK